MSVTWSFLPHFCRGSMVSAVSVQIRIIGEHNITQQAKQKNAMQGFNHFFCPLVGSPSFCLYIGAQKLSVSSQEPVKYTLWTLDQLESLSIAVLQPPPHKYQLHWKEVPPEQGFLGNEETVQGLYLDSCGGKMPSSWKVPATIANNKLIALRWWDETWEQTFSGFLSLTLRCPAQRRPS